MRRISLFLVVVLALVAQSSSAIAGSSTLAVTPGSGASLRVGTDGSANLFGNGAICDGAACALLASVNAAGTPGTNGLAIQGLTGGVPVPISAASLPLPTGASTAAGLTTINTTLGSPFQAGGSIGNTAFGISGTLPAFAATPTVTAAQATAASLNATVVGTGTFATQLTGATNNINNISGTVSLPTGAATSANQTNASQKTQIVDGSGNVIASTSNNLDVQCANCSGSGVSTADGAAWTAGTSLFAGVGGAYQTTVTSNPLTTGHQGFAQLTQYRALMNAWFNSSGIEMGTPTTPVQVSLANTGVNGTAVKVDGSGVTQPVSGAVTANAGANLNTSLLALETGGNLAGVNTLLGAKTDAKSTATDATTVSAMQVWKEISALEQAPASRAVTNAGTFATQVTQWAGATLGAMANYGTSPGAVLVPGVNASVTSSVLPAGAATAANQPTNAAQASTTAGQTGNLHLGAVTTAAPTYTTGQTDPISLDTSGNLRVNCTTGCSSSGGSSLADEGTFTQGTTSFTVGGGVFTTSPVNLTTGQAGAFRLTNDRKLMVDQPNSEVLQGGATAAVDALQAGGVYNSSPPTLTTGQGAALQLTAAGSLHATIDNSNANVQWNADGVANATNGSPTTSLLMAYNGLTVDRLEDDSNKNLKVAQQATPVGGASTSGAIVPNNTTAVVLKASAGTLYGVQLAGLGSAPAYLKLYNATSATCGSGTPVKRLMIPAASAAANGAGSNISFGPQGIAFGTGITYCVTTGIADTDTTAPAASTFLVNVDWD